MYIDTIRYCQPRHEERRWLLYPSVIVNRPSKSTLKQPPSSKKDTQLAWIKAPSPKPWALNGSPPYPLPAMLHPCSQLINIQHMLERIAETNKLEKLAK